MKAGDPIEQVDDELFIQIPKDRIINNDVGSDLFRPRTVDNNKKSMDWSGKTDLERSYDFHKSNFGITGGACVAKVSNFNEHDIAVIYDPLDGKDGKPENPAHCYGDYSKLSTSKQKNAGKKLKRAIIDSLVTFD